MKVALNEGQVIANIDTNKCFFSEQDGSGSIFRLDLEGVAVVNGKDVPVYFDGSNTGTNECMEELATKLAKLFVGYKLNKSMLIEPENFDIEEDTTIKDWLVAYLSEELNVGCVFELVFKDSKIELVCINDDNASANYSDEESRAEEEEDENDDFELEDEDEEEGE